jgi:hypothetical protein
MAVKVDVTLSASRYTPTPTPLMVPASVMGVLMK